MSAFDDLIPKKPAQPKVVFQGNANPRIPLDTENARLDAQRKQQQIQDAEIERQRKARQDAATGGVDASVDQGKAAAFALRAREANAAYERAGLSPESMIGAYGNQAFPGITANLSSDTRNAVRGNEREFIAGVLRYDSGAAIPDSEYDNAYRIYFPSSNAGPEEIESKRQARLRAVQGLVLGAGPAAIKLPDARLAAPDAKATTIPVPPQMQQRLADYVANNKGKLNPADFASAYNFIAQEAGYEGRVDPNSPQTIAEIEALNNGAPFGGSAPVTRDLSESEQGVNALAQSPVGAGLIGVGQTVTGNFLDELAGGNAGAGIDQIQENSPIASGVGQLAGGLLLPVGKAVGLAGATGAAAGYGAVAGAGAGEGGFTERLDDAALGAGIGAAGGYFGSKLLAKLGGGKPSSPPSASAKTPLEVSNEMGIDLTAGAGGGLSAKIVDQTLSNMVGSAGIMNTARQKLSGQVEDALGDVASKAGNATGNRGLGGSIKRGIDSGMKRASAKVGALYDSISVPQNATSVVNSTIGRLDEMAAKYSSNPDLAKLQVSPKIVAYRDALRAKVYSQDTGLLDASGNAIKKTVEQPGGLSFEDLKQFRTEIGDEIGEALIGEGTSRKELRGLYGALSEDMEATAASFGPKALSEFKRANMAAQRNFDLQEKVFAPLIGKDGDNSVESIANRFRALVTDGKATADLNDFAKLRGAVGSEEWGDAQSAFVRMMGQPLKSEGRDFSVQTFVKTLDDMTPKAKNILFGSKGPLRESLEDFAVVARKLAERDALRNTSNTAGQVTTGGLIAGIGGLPALAASAAASAVFAKAFTSKTAAKLFVEPKFVKWATGYMRMLRGAEKANGQPNNAKQMELLQKIAVAEPAIAGDIAGLQNALQSAFSSTPARLAATPNQENRE